MANKGIKGITLSFNGDVKPLEKALKTVDSQAKTTQQELKEVEKASKLDPSSVELYSQKQQLLQQAVQDTSQRLDVLKQAQAQVEQQFQNGDIGVEQYRAFQRELVTTESQLKSYQSQIQTTAQEYTRLEQANKDLQTFFQATETDVSQFADVLGTRLTTAIQNGSASADQINRALQLMGKQALGSSADIDKIRQALASIDSSGLQGVRSDLAQVAREANEAGEEVNGFGESLSAVAGGLLAGGGLASIVSQALDSSTLDTKIDITLDLDKESANAARESVKSVTIAIGDEETALAGVRKQFALNSEASDAENKKIIEGATAIAYAYSEIDFTEVIQESYEIGKELGISQEEAVGLINALLEVGFPPDQIDIIAEYGSQLKTAGFNALQIQAIFASGIDTGTWNIDNLLDGIKEGRIVGAELGQELSKEFLALTEEAGLSGEKFQQWGKQIASGGQEGAIAMQSVAKELAKVEDDTLRNTLGTQLYGTLWEEQGQKIVDTLVNMDSNLTTTEENQKKLNDNIEKLNSDAFIKLRTAVSELNETFKPLYDVVADIIASFADFASKNSTLVAILITIAGVIALVVGSLTLLAPIVSAITASVGLLTTAFGAISLPVVAIVAGIVALIAILVLAYKNFEGFREVVDKTFSTIKEVVLTALEFVKEFIKQKLEEIKQFWNENGEQIKQAVTNIWNGIKAVFETVMPFILNLVETVWNGIKTVIDGVLKVIQGYIKVFASVFTGDWQGVWDGIKQILSGAVDIIKGLIQTSFIGNIIAIFKTFAGTVKDLFKSLGDTLKGIWESISGFASTTWNKIKDSISTAVDTAKTNVTNAFNNIKNAISTTITTAKDIVNNIFNTIKNNITIAVTAIASVVSDKFATLKDKMAKPIETAKDLIKKAIDAIKGFFSNLSLKLPNIKLPKLPKFTIKGKFGFDPPSVPKLGIDFFAKGGLMTKPTAFGMNGNNLMVGGEAGQEAILPLTSKVLGSIGDGIAKTMSNVNQPQVIYVSPAPIILDGQTIAEVTFDTVSELQANYTNIKGLSKGVNI